MGQFGPTLGEMLLQSQINAERRRHRAGWILFFMFVLALGKYLLT